jgi:hypothetical protein
MRALSSQRNTGFATGDWATGVWTGTENNAQLAFTGATDIVNFLNNEFSGTTNQTISVNGGEPMAYGGYGGGGSNVTFFVDVAPHADPTTITSIEFGYYYQSRIEIDNDDDEINIRGQGLNININSDESVDIGATNSVEIVSDTIVSLLNNSATNPIIIRTSNGNTNQTWEFGASGNLTLPRGGIVSEGTSPSGLGNTVAISPSGGSNADQQLLVYPTIAEGNHLHLTTGNLYNTELYLGNDDLYVKLANTGNIVINSNNGVGNSAQWTFGTAGTILNSGNLTLQTPNGVPGAVTAITGSSGFWESNPRNNLATAGGTGTGLTVNVTEDGGYATAITIATPGTGYSNGDSISVVSGSSDASFTISVLANGWTFNTAGTLTLPGGSQIRPLGANLDIFAGTGSYVNLITSDESSSMGVDNGGGYIVTAGGTWQFGTTGNLTAPGNISAVGNIVGGNLNVGSGTITGGNVNGANFNGNVAFGTGTVGGSGNITGGNISAAGNVTVTGNLNVTGTAGNVATKSSGAWTVTPGTNNYSFTVDSSNTYQMWVEGNIANGIIAWNALATITNTNVPVIGQQFAWNYEGAGNPIVFTSIPAQIIGTAGAISNASPMVANTNVFTFGINNTSGSNQTVRYGWVRIS